MTTIEEIRRQAGEAAPSHAQNRAPDHRVEAECTPVVMGAMLRVATLAHWIESFPEEVHLSVSGADFSLVRSYENLWRIGESDRQLAGMLDRHAFSEANVPLDWSTIARSIDLYSPEAAAIVADLGRWGTIEDGIDLTTLGPMLQMIAPSIPKHTLQMSISLGNTLPRLLYGDVELNPMEMQRFAAAWLKELDILNIHSSSVDPRAGESPLLRLVRRSQNHFVSALFEAEGTIFAYNHPAGRPGAIELAALKGNTDLIRIFLLNGLKIEHHGHTIEAIIESASQNGPHVAMETFEVLLAAGLDLASPLPHFGTAMEAVEEVVMEDPSDTELGRILTEIAQQIDVARSEKDAEAIGTVP